MLSEELTALPTTSREDATPPGEGSAAAGRRAAGPVRRPPDAALLAHVVEHHAYARRALPYLVALLTKVVAAHRRRNPKLAALYDAGQELAEALEGHVDDEERDLFPALGAAAPAHAVVARELERMRRHHDEVRLLLARIRWLSDDYATPAWGGRSYQLLMEELEALEEDVLEHVHLESFALGPRLAGAARGG
jgi:regulator of cell morphogenesis and NO signaling